MDQPKELMHTCYIYTDNHLCCFWVSAVYVYVLYRNISTTLITVNAQHFIISYL